MQITVTIEPDVEPLLRQTMRGGVPLDRLVNDALRERLSAAERSSAAASGRYTQITFDMGEPLVDLTKANALADELGDLAMIAKLDEQEGADKRGRR